MPSRYDSTFWLQRAQETQVLSDQMKGQGAKASMGRLARKYERIALQSAYDEARIAFDSAREALRVSQGAASREQIASITETIDVAWSEMQKTKGKLDIFRHTHLLIIDGVEVLDGEDLAASAR